MRPNLPSEGSAPRQRAGENDFYDPPRAFTVIFRVHSTATVARTVPCSAHRIARESSSPARRLSPGCAPPPARGRKRLFPPRRRSEEPASPRTRAPTSGTRAPDEQPHDVGGIRLRVEALKRVRIRLRKEARRRKRLLRPTSCLHGNLPRPLDRHGRANRALARRITRIFVSRASAFARLRKVPACGQKRLLRPSR